MFKRGNIPHLFGGPQFTEKTLRFAWHITSICWLGFAAILIAMANNSVSASLLGYIIGTVFLISFLITIFASKAKHYAWTIFLAVGVISIYSVSV
ncbi:MAG: hypothetical protein V2I33_08915 [Kangiellaceae bacterium]|nr:hypothetical protein [Kangiellaceae bacterium]